MIQTFVKKRNAMNSLDYESWGGCDISRTLNIFENQNDLRATVIIVEQDEANDNNINREKIF